MKKYYGEQQDLVILTKVSLDEFYEKYRKLCYGENTRVTASQQYPLSCGEGDKQTYDCIIYFDIVAPVEKIKPKVFVKLGMKK